MQSLLVAMGHCRQRGTREHVRHADLNLLQDLRALTGGSAKKLNPEWLGIMDLRDYALGFVWFAMLPRAGSLCGEATASRFAETSASAASWVVASRPTPLGVSSATANAMRLGVSAIASERAIRSLRRGSERSARGR